MNDKPKIIELIGISGSGKSTLHKKLIATGEYEDIKVAALRSYLKTDIAPRLFKLIFSIVPITWGYTLGISKILYLHRTRVAVRLQREEDKNFVNFFINKISGNQLKHHEKILLLDRIFSNYTDFLLVRELDTNKKPILADEFFLQKMFPICLTDNEIEDYISKSPESFMTIYLDNNPDESLKRLKQRSSLRNVSLKNMSDKEILHRLQNGKKIFSAAINYLLQSNKRCLQITEGDTLKEIDVKISRLI